MSRTKKGSKAVGYDFWTRRPGNKHGANGCGPYAKLRTHKMERVEEADLIRNELDSYNTAKEGA